MGTTLPLGALLALSLASCSSSGNSLTGPDDIKPSTGPVDPAREEPGTHCAAPSDHPAAISSASGSGASSAWYSSRIMSSRTACTWVSP
jgi:hypothetical protein